MAAFFMVYLIGNYGSLYSKTRATCVNDNRLELVLLFKKAKKKDQDRNPVPF